MDTMTIIQLAAVMPLTYLLITGAEYLFWPSRFEKIRKQFTPDLLSLTIASVVMMGVFWISDNVTLCWQ